MDSIHFKQLARLSKVPFLPLLAISLVLASPKLIANTNSQNSLLSLSLEELLNTTVVSQKKETIKSSPGVVSSYRIEDLRRLGLRDLNDMLAYFPSVEHNPTLAASPILQIRGLSDAFNQKILFLVDGVPYWMPSSADLPINGIPISAIEKIELIRGPASVLYGSNASAGVINIVTRNDSQSELSISSGERGRYQAGMHYGGSFLQEGQINFSAERRQSSAYRAGVKNAFNKFDPDCNCFPETLSGSIDTENESSSFLLRASHSGFSLHLQTHKSDSQGGADGSILSPMTREEYGNLIALSYRYEFNELQQVNVFTDRNHYYSKFEIDDINGLFGIEGDGSIHFRENGDDNYRLRHGIQYRHVLNEAFDFLLGAEHETRRTNEYIFERDDGGSILESFGFILQEDGTILLIDSGKISESGIYAQLDYHVGNFAFSGGLRHVSNNEYGEKLTPRLSTVYSFAKNHSFKLLYSEGFNSPSFRQSAAVNQEGRPSTATLAPEILSSRDIAYTYTNTNHHFVVNMYSLQIKDILTQVNGEYKNAEHDAHTGAEMEYQYRFDKIQISSGLSYLINEKHEGHLSHEFQANPKLLLKLGLSAHQGPQSFGFSLRHSGSRQSAGPYSWMNLFYEYSFSKISVFGNIENALNQKITYPDLRSKSKYIFDAIQGRNIELGIRFSF